MWRAENLPFRIEFFHPGYLYQEPVHVNEFTPTHVQPIRFVQDFFDYGSLNIQNQIPANTGYAGFRVLYPAERDEPMGRTRRVSRRELFPAAGQGPALRPVGARAGRWIAAETDRPEEFPIFTDWWLGKPQKDDKELTLVRHSRQRELHRRV